MVLPTETTLEHDWKPGVWEQIAPDRVERVDKCFICGSYRVASKTKLTDTVNHVVYYPSWWTGHPADKVRLKKRPPCIEKVNYDAND